MSEALNSMDMKWMSSKKFGNRYGATFLLSLLELVFEHD